jgi:hypothetical protein
MQYWYCGLRLLGIDKPSELFIRAINYVPLDRLNSMWKMLLYKGSRMLTTAFVIAPVARSNRTQTNISVTGHEELLAKPPWNQMISRILMWHIKVGSKRELTTPEAWACSPRTKFAVVVNHG